MLVLLEMTNSVQREQVKCEDIEKNAPSIYLALVMQTLRPVKVGSAMLRVM